MLTRGWIMDYAASRSHGIAEGTGLVNRDEKHHVKVDCTSILISTFPVAIVPAASPNSSRGYLSTVN